MEKKLNLEAWTYNPKVTSWRQEDHGLIGETLYPISELQVRLETLAQTKKSREQLRKRLLPSINALAPAHI